MDYDLIWRKDARHAVLHNDGQAAVAAIEEIPAVEMRPQIYGYDLENLRLFAELCKDQGVTDKDLKNVASDVTWAVQAVYDANDRAFHQMITENTENGVVARFAVELPPPINTKRFEHVFDGAQTVKLPKLNVEIPKRLIDANALIPKMRERFWKRGREGDAVCLIEDAPTVGMSLAWISVEERLPENDDEVLVAYKCKYEPGFRVSTDCYTPRAGRWDLDRQYTHWMPLPEPPRKE